MRRHRDDSVDGLLDRGAGSSSATLVNVCGTSYSGTTMLDLMLGNSATAFSCGEVYAWFRPWRPHHLAPQCSCGSESCPWNDLKDLRGSEFHEGVASHLNVRFVIDSSKDLCWLADATTWAMKAGMPVFNMLLWKEPRQFAYSHWKRTGSIMTWRQSFLGYYEKFLSLRLSYSSINFAQLVQDPVGHLSRICECIGMEYHVGKEEFWRRPHHQLFGNHATRRQVAAGDSRISADEPADAEFLARWQRMDRRLAADGRVQRVLRELWAHEVSNVRAPMPQASRVRRPLWYYAHRGRAAFRRLLLWPPRHLPPAR